MKKIILIRYGELTLKGNNRAQFENKLRENIKLAFKKSGIVASIKKIQSRLIVQTEMLENAIAVLERIFGISSISETLLVEAEAESILKAAFSIALGGKFASFAIRAKRISKDFMPTMEIERWLGKHIHEKTSAKVDLVSPDLTLWVEINNKQAYIFCSRKEGAGGLPVGTEGTVLAIINQPLDVMAAWLLLKRGCLIIPVMKKQLPEIEILETFFNPLQPIQQELASHNALLQTGHRKIYEKTYIPNINPLCGKSKKEWDTALNRLILKYNLGGINASS